MTSEQAVCEVCGKTLSPRAPGQRACPGQCTWLLHKRDKKNGRPREKKQPQERRSRGARSGNIPTRRFCHDCGAPTNNYRCPACLAKWRYLYGVVGGSHSEFCDFHGGHVDIA